MDETDCADELDGSGIDLDRSGVVVMKIARYPILRKLGEGAMGVVFAAYDELLDRKLAIKLLRPRKRKQDGTRLLREAQGLARLSHANVVQIYEIGEYEGAVFMAMEFVAGQTLGAWLEAEPRSRAEILAAFTAAGRGLAAAHAARLVHRDFKPDNVMVGADGQVKVMDFGLVRAEGSPAPATTSTNTGTELDHSSGELLSDETLPSLNTSQSSLGLDLTKSGSVLGTPAYMAPEQHLGQATDARSDQFSFCVALWQALYGVRPFLGDTIPALTFNVLRGKVSEPPREAEVPTWLRQVLERGLSLEPDQRWPSIDALLAALADDPTRRRPAILAGVGSLLAVVAVVGGGWSWQRAEQARARAARDAAIATCTEHGRSVEAVWNDELAAQTERAFTATKLAFAPDAWTRTRAGLDAYARSWAQARAQLCVEAEVEGSRDAETSARALSCLDERRAALRSLAALLAEADDARVLQAVYSVAQLPLVSDCSDPRKLAHLHPLPEDPKTRAQVEELRERLVEVEALQTMGEHERATAELRGLLDEAEALAWPPLIAAVEYRVAALASKAGDYTASRAAGERALFMAASSGDDVLAADAAVALVYGIGVGLELPEDGLRMAKLAEVLISRTDGSGSLLDATLHVNIGAIHDHQGDLDGALVDFERALEIQEALLPPAHPSTSVAVSNIGTIHARRGRNDEAIVYFERALAMREASLPAGHPRLAVAYENVGNIYSFQAKYDQAQRYIERALAINEANLPAEHRDIARSLANLGNVHYFREDYEQALAYYRRTLAIRTATLGRDHVMVGTAHKHVGLALIELEDYDGAIEQMRRALEINEASFGPDDPRYGPKLSDSYENLGNALRNAGQYAEAIRSLERALELRVAHESPPLTVAGAQWYLAHALWDGAQKRRDEAIELMRACHAAYAEQGSVEDAEEAAAWLRKRGAAPSG
ncbi:Serine/threonine-protein kinase PK-1 [Enhygromyxa salina]|uniref:Serine/threonine-protein kinase PK-1 n=1 Tax=Enhygromyxa salina TaxID=215803 RepID=A0A2S9YEY7_9BACT|nr:serine/threonine-protein kinase [Enhygromyxa salina]PRQ03667.1 Serine/threonine-protein kinase PK-1 [Enhygromyxa salina]